MITWRRILADVRYKFRAIFRSWMKPVEPSNEFLLKRVEHHEKAVREYVELETRGEKVIHLEKVKSETVFGDQMDAWDVYTNRDRFWVITNPTNLYSQRIFPSLDYVISFHVGLMTRVNAQHMPVVTEEEAEQKNLSSAWRLWIQAGEALDASREVEDFQAVGMRCRECLLDFIRIAPKEGIASEGEIIPKEADFIAWTSLLAEKVAPGKSSEHPRSYLKSLSKETWELVNWLTHTKNANRVIARLCVDSTSHFLTFFNAFLFSNSPRKIEECPECKSKQVSSDYRGDEGFFHVCDVCGWEAKNDEQLVGLKV